MMVRARMLALLCFLVFCGCAAAQPVARPLPDQRPATRTVTRSVAPAVVLVLLEAGGIGTGLGAMAASSSKNVDAAVVKADLLVHHGNCVPDWSNFNTKVCADIQDKLDAADLYRTIATGAFIGGGAAAAGAVLYLLWSSPQGKTPNQAVVRNLRLTPMLSPTGSELHFSGSF